MKLLLLALVVAVVGFGLYVRLSPTDPNRFRVQNAAANSAGVGDYPAAGGFTAVREIDFAQFDTLVEVALATPRTRLIAGSVTEKWVTLETRSLMWGFPDYTNIYIVPETGQLVVFGTLRFGRSDLGVNQKRIRSWLSEAGIA